MSVRRVVVFGPGPQFKGGIANYNTSLAKALDRRGDMEVHIVSWTQQYPFLIPRDFMDRKSKRDQLEGTGIRVHYLLNYNNPLTWRRTVRLIRDLAPEKVVIQWSIALQGIPLRFLAKQLRKAGIPVFFDLHFVVQKENSGLDRMLSRRCLRHGDVYIVHALKTYEELRELFPGTDYHLCYPGDAVPREGKRVLKLFHPVYDMFQKDPGFDVDAFKAGIGLRKHVFLFFGFIRKYKGLHHVLEAFHLLSQRRNDVSLLVVGELFWHTLDKKKLGTRVKSALFGLAKRLFMKRSDDEGMYNPLGRIDEYGMTETVKAFTDFVPNEEVHKYFQASDAITLFYERATPSGVESMAYNFGLPILATDVGHFSETVKHGYNGYLAVPGDPRSMADAMEEFLVRPIPQEHVVETAAEMSWSLYADVVSKH